MKKVELLQTQKHPSGDIKKGSIFEFDESRNMYVLKNKNGDIISSVNDAFINMSPHLFKRIN